MTKLIIPATNVAGENGGKSFFKDMIGEIPLGLTNGIEKTQIFIAKNPSNQDKNIDIDPKKRIVYVTEDVTMAKSTATARENLNS